MAGEKSPKSKPGSARSSQSPKWSNPRSKEASPEEGSPQAPLVAGILPAQHWVDTAQEHEADAGDVDSIADSVGSSTNSLTSSIVKYRQIHGRTYHSEIGNASYWGANDSQQNDSMDINHHVLLLMLRGKLFLAPLETDKIQKVLDIGTGTGSWAIDFADEYPMVEVIGTDISPIQPSWVPSNLKFEIEDCSLEWTFQSNSVDYVHMRFLIGSISDWEALYTQAYRTLRPGGWLESYESGSIIGSDDGTVPEDSALGQWGKLFINFGEVTGRPFSVVNEGIQLKAMQAAGFVDIQVRDLKTPLGTWPKDPEQKEIGEYAQAVLESDFEGYLLYPATALGWTPEEVAVYAAHLRREFRSPKTHPYYRQKIVWGRKPANPEAS